MSASDAATYTVRQVTHLLFSLFPYLENTEADQNLSWHPLVLAYRSAKTRETKLLFS